MLTRRLCLAFVQAVLYLFTAASGFVTFFRSIDLAPMAKVEAERVQSLTQKTEYSAPAAKSKHDNGRNIAKAFQSLLRDLNSRCMAFA